MTDQQHIASDPESGAPRIRPSTGRPWRLVLYAALAIAGLIGTWWANVAFFADSGGMTYLESWFANPGATSAAIDLLVVSAAACVFCLVEAARLGWSRWAWLVVVLGLAIAMAFTIPAFLAIREWALWRRSGALAGGGSAPTVSGGR